MTDMIFRVPSRTVQYGYVELPVGMQDGSSPELIAAAYVSYVYAFQKEEQAAVDRIAERPPAAPAEADPRDSIGDPDKALEDAVKALNDGLGGVSAVEEHEDNGVPPWDKKVDAKPKPWEAGSTAPKAVVTEDW